MTGITGGFPRLATGDGGSSGSLDSHVTGAGKGMVLIAWSMVGLS